MVGQVVAGTGARDDRNGRLARGSRSYVVDQERKSSPTHLCPLHLHGYSLGLSRFEPPSTASAAKGPVNIRNRE